MFYSLYSGSLLISILLLFSVAASFIEPQVIHKTDSKDDVQKTNPDNTAVKEKPAILQIEDKTKVENVATSNTNSTSNNATASDKPHDGVITILPSNLQSDDGALKRLFFVLFGICTIFVVYVAYRFYRTTKGGPRPTAVRKYGVLTQRTDIEMLPLPLDDEEDDDTVFDVGNHVNNR